MEFMKKFITIIFLYYSGLSGTNVFAFSIFGPGDNEECRIEAAKEAKTREALAIFLRKCNDDFPAIRRPSGGYQFYDSETSQWIPVNSAAMSKSDWERVAKARSDFKEAVARAQRENDIQERQRQSKNAAARRDVAVLDWSIKCINDYYCNQKQITVRVQNRSTYNLDSVSFGLLLSSGKLNCNTNIKTSNEISINIPSNQTATVAFITYDGPLERFSGCIQVTDVSVI